MSSTSSNKVLLFSVHSQLSLENMEKLSSQQILNSLTDHVDSTSDDVDLVNQLDTGDMSPQPAASAPMVNHQTAPYLQILRVKGSRGSPLDCCCGLPNWINLRVRQKLSNENHKSFVTFWSFGSWSVVVSTSNQIMSWSTQNVPWTCLPSQISPHLPSWLDRKLQSQDQGGSTFSPSD